jgi:hypothetical protein
VAGLFSARQDEDTVTPNASALPSCFAVAGHRLEARPRGASDQLRRDVEGDNFS